MKVATALIASMVLTAIAPTAAKAETWLVHNWNDVEGNFALYMVNPESLKRQGNTAQIWTRSVWEKPRINGVTERQALNSYDCAKETSTILSIVARTASGKVVAVRSISPYEQEEDYVVPGSVGSTSMGYVCRDEFDGWTAPSDIYAHLKEVAAFARAEEAKQR